jgi:hypothetical protein
VEKRIENAIVEVLKRTQYADIIFTTHENSIVKITVTRKEKCDIVTMQEIIQFMGGDD